VVVGEQGRDPGLGEDRGEELLGDRALQEPLAVLGEHRHVPDRHIHRQSDEPAKQQIVVELLHQLPLGAHRVEGLQEERPQQLLGRNGGPAGAGVEPRQLAREPLKRLVHNGPDRPQRMIRRHARLAAHIGEQALRPLIRPAHHRTPRPATRIMDS
jgi:hypothetical protein